MPVNWITGLKEAAAAESGPLVATVATVRSTPAGPVPEARSVVVRNIADDGGLTFTSHAASEKEKQLQQSPRVAVVFWLAATRTQFRVNGPVALLGVVTRERLETWRAMSPGARATFAWPPPGRPRETDDHFVEKDDEPEPPASFDAWVVTPESVETLDLRPHPHRRQIWSRGGDGWASADVNP